MLPCHFALSCLLRILVKSTIFDTSLTDCFFYLPHMNGHLFTTLLSNSHSTEPHVSWNTQQPKEHLGSMCLISKFIDSNRKHRKAYYNRVCVSYHTAAEGTGPWLDVRGYLVSFLFWLRSECVQRHRAAGATEGATAQRFTTAAWLKSHRATSCLILLHLIYFQPSSFHRKKLSVLIHNTNKTKLWAQQHVWSSY